MVEAKVTMPFRAFSRKIEWKPENICNTLEHTPLKLTRQTLWGCPIELNIFSKKKFIKNTYKSIDH